MVFQWSFAFAARALGGFAAAVLAPSRLIPARALGRVDPLQHRRLGQFGAEFLIAPGTLCAAQGQGFGIGAAHQAGAKCVGQWVFSRSGPGSAIRKRARG